jgi:predicted nucleic-acid-binding protein
MRSVIIDTNIILRFFLHDIPSQTPTAQKLMSEIEEGRAEGYISLLVVNEVLWILQKFYKVKREDFMPLLLKMLSYEEITIIETKKRIVIQSLLLFLEKNIDFTDSYLFTIAGDKEILSFDEDIKKLLKRS